MLDWLKSNYSDIEIDGDSREGPRGGARVLSFGSPMEELYWLTSAAALLPETGWELFIVEGPDAGSYLHRRLSHSIRDLPDGLGRHALQLEGDGRMSAELLVYRMGNEYHCLAPRATAAAACALTDKFTLMDDVRVYPRWDREGTIGLAGPLAPMILAEVAGDSNTASDLWTFICPAEIAGQACRIHRDGRWSQPFYHITAHHEAMPAILRVLSDHGEAMGGGAAGWAALDTMRLIDGLPLFGLDATPETIPLEVGLDSAIDFNKGCFPGQEVLARIRNLGHPARLLARIETFGEHEIAPGTPLLIDDEQVGKITSSRTLPGLGRTLALGSLLWKHRKTPDVTIQTGGGALNLSILDVRGSDAYQDEVKRHDL